MTIKIIFVIMLLSLLGLLCRPFVKTASAAETPIDTAWWNGLTDEWKIIFLINQNFQKQGADIFKIQNEYINRLNKKGEAGYSALNRSLNDLNEDLKFELGYDYFYARSIRTNHVVRNDKIDLNTLPELETIYMVNGPGDLTPLKKFPHLKVLIINSCGVDNNLPLSKQILDLEPLKYLKELKVLHCSSNALSSLEPIKDLVSLEELYCDRSSVTSLQPLRKLKNLRILSFGSKVDKAAVVEGLTSLRELYIKGCKQVPNLSKLINLQKLSFSEGEMAIINSGYRVHSIEFLRNLPELQFLDLKNTSYNGSLEDLSNLNNLKAVTLPSVSRSEFETFKDLHKKCVIINSYEYE